MAPPKPVATVKVRPPTCRKCGVFMCRNYERMVWVCPLCRNETAKELVNNG